MIYVLYMYMYYSFFLFDVRTNKSRLTLVGILVWNFMYLETEPVHVEVFYGVLYDLLYTTDWKNDSYVIEKNLYVRIWRLRLILYYRFFSYSTVVFIGHMDIIKVISEM
jgi:hypothetical protein